MNIFVLDDDPIIAAMCQCDKHVVKMVLETGQILSTIQRQYGNENVLLYKATHAHHPCTVWAGKTRANYYWLVDHFVALANEYLYRYGREHATFLRLYDVVAIAPQGIDKAEKTEYALAMPNEYKCDDAVKSYRNYYTNAKREFLTYTKRSKPVWMMT